MDKLEHANLNQINYKNNSDLHNRIGINSTLYLAYRDIPEILKKFFFTKPKDRIYKILDYGCGTGLSTDLITKMVIRAGYKIEICGVDINEENLAYARLRIPDGKFEKIDQTDKLENIGQFDLIICNFVLVEHPFSSMVNLLEVIYDKLKKDSILIITNPSSKVYDKEYSWYSINNDFIENEKKNKRTKNFKDDQPVKLQVINAPSLTFTFFDYFHSEISYRKAYRSARLKLLMTHQPLGVDKDKIAWKSEKVYSPFVIHILTKMHSSEAAKKIESL